MKVAAITLLIVGLIGKLTGYSQILFFCIEFGLLGLIISAIYRRDFSFGLTIFCGTAFMLLIGAFFMIMIGLSNDTGPFDLILDYLKSNLEQSINAYKNMESDQENVIMLEHYGKILMNIITNIYPALLIIGTGFVVWINVIISKPLFLFGKVDYPDFGPMDRWQAPELMVWGVIAAGFALFFSIAGIRLVAINALIVMSVIYMFHGLTIALFFLNKYHVPRWIRLVLYVLIVFQQIFMVGLALGGLFDQWIDFRKIHRRKAK